ncbi:MAG: tRNA (adenosine(37)-N6)-threonylcarbamoyltransferase complex dimerization subunit type 1 TsaB [Rhizobiales bacterium 17-65-6]|nr:MAG: tRNA (adenosine(37)-N6)-threonylcarbamoyltransferase complex dimerization subunit type 1 TsaB [Rhizobiales bacterium 12-68-15]OYX87809.1 MAG: tRNA (adenosine(37)-N6)-threonylcarbamoyltransferase complex dimerization subunit type 1 TsaB [Azorhizobium sp. 32-67-21]OYY13125.1 MAG: tRNA (adenosine(37)-N6)-threonylcarbamoyltransferase complex dimerization subunit type 1 TsaB [Rhizobiales bacterium 35-68-8]OYZ99450.1 MAG: tRNA (adenosine(37)-N6)-threonylcarbamoyltransferase complex dimerizatio
MLVLAIDTALTACSVAVLDADADTVVAGDSLFMDRGHAEALVPMVEQVLTGARLEFSAIDRIAVTVGPGSFTGLRVGLSAARSFALAAGKPAVGVTTLAALAAPFLALDDSTPVLAAIDARHGHVFMQVFGTGGRTLVSPRIAAVKDAARAAAMGAVRLVGSGAALVAEAWPPGEVAPALVETLAVPDVAWVARLGAAADPATAEPRPLYLRSPDAKPQTAARIARR